MEVLSGGNLNSIQSMIANRPLVSQIELTRNVETLCQQVGNRLQEKREKQSAGHIEKNPSDEDHPNNRSLSPIRCPSEVPSDENELMSKKTDVVQPHRNVSVPADELELLGWGPSELAGVHPNEMEPEIPIDSSTALESKVQKSFNVSKLISHRTQLFHYSATETARDLDGRRIPVSGSKKLFITPELPRPIRQSYRQSICHYCMREFVSFTAMRDHLYTTSHHEVYLCCQRTFQLYAGFVNHVRLKHGAQVNFNLNVCSSNDRSTHCSTII
jgi:hypothetical protein